VDGSIGSFLHAKTRYLDIETVKIKTVIEILKRIPFISIWTVAQRNAMYVNCFMPLTSLLIGTL
jgi:hypothetical protein